MKGKTKMASKKMMRGGAATKTAPKRMRGGGMMKAASKKKMMRAARRTFSEMKPRTRVAAHESNACTARHRRTTHTGASSSRPSTRSARKG